MDENGKTADPVLQGREKPHYGKMQRMRHLR
jgi:hypothetical protein